MVVRWRLTSRRIAPLSRQASEVQQVCGVCVCVVCSRLESWLQRGASSECVYTFECACTLECARTTYLEVTPQRSTLAEASFKLRPNSGVKSTARRSLCRRVERSAPDRGEPAEQPVASWGAPPSARSPGPARGTLQKLVVPRVPERHTVNPGKREDGSCDEHDERAEEYRDAARGELSQE